MCLLGLRVCLLNNPQNFVVGGVPLEEMNILEMEFLENMGYRVHIFPKEFHQYSDAVNGKVELLRSEGEIEVPFFYYSLFSSICLLLSLVLSFLFALPYTALQNNSDESSAYMIYSLIFDSYKNNNNSEIGEEHAETEQNDESGGEIEEEITKDRRDDNNRSNDDYKGVPSILQTSQEFSCHMDGGRDNKKEKGDSEKERDKKKKRRRNKKKKQVLYQ